MNKRGSKFNYKRITLGSLVAFLLMLLYVPSLLNWLSGDNIARDVIRIGTIEESVNANGILAREEELLDAPVFGGRYIAEIGEGERTPANSLIATVLNNTSDTLMKEMEAVNGKITKALMEKAEKADFFSEDIVKLDKEIGLKVQNLIMACNAQRFEEIGRYRTEIGRIVEKKAEIVGESSTDSYISSLQQQKEAIQKKINKNTVQVMSNLSGIVSYAIDGYEALLTPESLPYMTPKQLDSIREEYSKRQERGSRALAGMPLAKIIKGTNIYIAAALSEESASAFKAGDSVKLRINDISFETEGVVAYVNEPENGKAVIAVNISRGADILSAVRIINADFISKTEEGLKVPLRCLMDISSDGSKAKIMLVKYNMATSRKVDIICKDEEYAIIRTPDKEINKTVNLYDTYIINPDKIKEGGIVEK